MERDGSAEENQNHVPTPVDQVAQREQYKSVGETFGLDAADDPFAGQLRVIVKRKEQCGGKHGGERSRHKPPTQALPRPGEQQPHGNSADPRRGREREPARQPAEQPNEHDLGIGRFEEQVALAPRRIPVVFEPADVVGFIYSRRRVAGGNERKLTR